MASASHIRIPVFPDRRTSYKAYEGESRVCYCDEDDGGTEEHPPSLYRSKELELQQTNGYSDEYIGNHCNVMLVELPYKGLR